MDTSDPEIIFDGEGVCSHCYAAERKLQHWQRGDDGQVMLERFSQQIREHGRNQEYDCIIGVSGGVDSSYLLHVAKTIMNLRPLVVHVDAGWNSELAVKNIENLVKALDLDLYTYVVDWEEMKDLQVAYLKSSLANQDVPQDHVFFAKLYKYAIKNNIKYVLTGANYSSESILPSSWSYDASDSKQLLAIHKRFGSRSIRNYPTMSFWQRKFIWPYLRGMKRVDPLNYLDYNKEQAMAFLMKNYGWRYYGGKHHESRWTKFFQSYYLPKKFGFDKRRAHLSSLIAARQLTRAEALEELKIPPFDETRIDADKDFVAAKLGLERVELDRLIDRPKAHYSDFPNNESLSRLFSRAKLLVNRLRK